MDRNASYERIDYGRIKMKVICLSGAARSGKDTAANVLRETFERRGKTVLITHYADLLKYICKTFFGWNGEKDDEGRSLLQYVGTDIVRNRDPNFWVDFIANILTLFHKEWDYVIISDARFPNEITRLKEFGINAIHVRVHRNGFESPLTQEQQKHESETALDNISPDYWLINDDLDGYKKKVNEFGIELLASDQNIVQLQIFDEVVSG